MISNLPNVPVDPIFKLWRDFQNDPRPEKINLGIGIYNDDHGQSYVMPSIQKAAQKIQTQNFDYVSMSGNSSFLETTGNLILGNLFNPQNTALQQTCGGTQAIYMWGQLMQKAGYKKVLFPVPTWENHFQLLTQFQQETFAHLSQTQEKADIKNYKDALKKAAPKSLLVLQGGSTHNPCGLNLSPQELEELIPILQEKGIQVLVDFAYLGLGDSLSEDAKWIQILWKSLDNISVALSYSKNACLYRHRTGALLIKTFEKEKIESHLQVEIRETISNPPAFGAEIMDETLNNNFDQWESELKNMKDSIDNRREKLIKQLPESFSFLLKTNGMFGLLPFSPEKVLELRKKHALYLLEDGRINFSSLQTEKIDQVAEILSKA